MEKTKSVRLNKRTHRRLKAFCDKNQKVLNAVADDVIIKFLDEQERLQ